MTTRRDGSPGARRVAPIPAVIRTADAMGSSPEEMIELSASAYLTKPFSSLDLLTVAAQILRSSSAS